jgi:hypothetical protein
MLRFALVILPLFVSLSACAGQGGFPSLAPRAAERGLAGGSAPALCPDAEAAPVAVAAVVAAPLSDPQLRKRVAGLVEAAQAGQREYSALLPGVENAVANAGPAESESWIAAQLEVSRLAAARGRTADALSELDALGLRRSAERAGNEEDLQAILQAAAEARSLAAQQQADLDRLSGRLGVEP